MVSTKTSARPKPKPAPKAAKNASDLESFRDIADDVIESDFVPYACLFDPATIATKDGELLQTIKITGGDTGVSLRQSIRHAIRECIPTDGYALWLHTLRRHQPHSDTRPFPDAFSTKVENAWRTQYPTSTAFVNELYLTIVRAGEGADLTDKATLRASLIPGRTGATRTAAMETALEELTAATTRMVKMLQGCGAARLTLAERNGVFYSEQLEFLEKLINLEARPMPVPTRDLSQVLTSGEITFGFNAMEVRTAEGKRRFAAILTLKEYKESTLAGIDQFLNIPCEVIISQSFDFMAGGTAREVYEKQARYLTISGDKELAQWMEIDRLMRDSKAASVSNFGNQQTSIFLIAPSVSQLEKNISMVQKALNRLGMVVVREDLHFEDCYWAQLPANFTFISRSKAVDTDHLAGFANLQTAPMGNSKGSPWGAPISVFTTAQDAPYFFNFHRGEHAHSIVLSPEGGGGTTFTHFLLTQTRKLPVRIWYLDARGRSVALVNAMGGKVAEPGTATCRLNPLMMEDSPANREFLSLWIASLIDPFGQQSSESLFAFFDMLVNHLFTLPREQRRISTLIPLIREQDPLLAAKLQPFAIGGAFGDLFDMPQDDFQVDALSSWNLGRWMNDPATRIPLVTYLLHRLTMALDTTPTLLVLDEGFGLLANPIFGPRVPEWCDYLTGCNAAALFLTHEIEASASFGYTPAIVSKAGTVFAMADADPVAGYSMGFGFTAEDIATLSYMDRGKHQVLQKRGGESVVLKADLSALGAPTLATLRGAAPTAVLSPAEQLAQLMGQPGNPA